MTKMLTFDLVYDIARAARAYRNAEIDAERWGDEESRELVERTRKELDAKLAEVWL